MVAALLSTDCAGGNLAQSMVELNQADHLGPERQLDLLARGYLVANSSEPRGFGMYVYLLFQPTASREARLTAARAWLAYPQASYRAFAGQVPPERMALMLLPILHAPAQAPAEVLVDDYDDGRAELISEPVRRAGGGLPPVALVAYPEPIGPQRRLEPSRLLVANACGDAEQVRVKFARLRHALVTGEEESAVLHLAERIYGVLLSFSSDTCR